MPFCRRCGDIVAAPRCTKCGGTAVAPVVSWGQPNPNDKSQDRWSKTYVQRPRSASPTKPAATQIPNSSISSFTNRPVSSISESFSGSKISLPLTITKAQSPSPLKSLTTSAPDILPSIDPKVPSLSRVYGSVLQRPETLETHSCAICSASFLPDATIYPHPSAPSSSKYLCRPCFEVNGGSKGSCPTCSRLVLTLKSEGGFIHAAGSYWHKRCFNCTQCGKNIGDSPMVDLFGKPSCAECFDSYLRRDPTTPKKAKVSSSHTSPSFPRSRKMTPVRSSLEGCQNEQASPAIVQELEQRLGIVKHREGSPALEDLAQTLTPHGKDSEPRSSFTTSVLGNGVGNLHDSATGSFKANPQAVSRPDAVQEIKQRFMKASSPSPHSKTSTRASPSIQGTPLRLSRSSTSLRASPRIFIPQSSDEPISPNSPNPPPTPDLMSDFSDTVTQYSSSDSPPKEYDDLEDVFTVCGHKVKTRYDIRSSKRDFLEGDQDDCTVATPSKDTPMLPRNPSGVPQNPSTPSLCASCHKSLFSVREGGTFITVPPIAHDSSPLTYHVHCFKCVICKGVFEEAASGQAAFVTVKGGPCHIQCAPVERITIKTTPSLSPSNPRSKIPLASTSPPVTSKVSPRSQYKSSRLERPSNPISLAMSRRFGSTTSCPGCKKVVSPMEHGVVPGPQGTRWHAPCLVCGGRRKSSGRWGIWKDREERSKGEPGCGKRLDSAAKTTSDGSVWCRECLLSLGVGGSPERAPPTTGSSKASAPQLIGTTTLARQFTGLGNSEPGLLSQLTGGGLSPTRSISPTKQLGNGIRARPKSVIGLRSTKSVDEGRGMFLVRQMTGAAGGN